MICKHYGIGEKCTKERLSKVPDPAPCTKFQKTCKKPMLTAFKNPQFFSLYMRGHFPECGPQLKCPQGKNTKQPVSVHRFKKHSYASRESVRTLSGFFGLPPKNPRQFCFSKLPYPHRFRFPSEPVIRR